MDPEKMWHLLEAYLKPPTLGGRERNVFATAGVLLHDYSQLMSCSDFSVDLGKDVQKKKKQNKENQRTNGA